ncbi:MAG TPA: putative sulfate exporter family transporter, partial [Ignavibacteriaceae bacterium]|nr:putative sulfate exporter family transporter [Ignavibacteriaceae bacterium]
KKTKIKLPLFILGFILTMIINTYIPSLSSVNIILSNLSKKILTVTLFLIGAGLTRERIKAVGVRPLLLGISIWIIISLVSLFAVQNIF